MVGVPRKERKDGDYCKAMFHATVGGREGVRGEEPAGAGMFIELLRSLDKWDML